MAFEAMKQASVALGLTLSPPEPGLLDLYSTITLTGEHQGAQVSIERNAALWTLRTRVLLRRQLPVHFALVREGVLSKLGHLIGLHDPEVGDPEFDKAFKLATDDPAAVRKLLTPQVTVLLRNLHQSGVDFRLTEQEFAVDRIYIRGMITAQDVGADLPFATSLVRALDAAVAG